MSAGYSYLSHLECSECQRLYSAEQLQTVSPCCGRPLLAVYDLAALRRNVTPGELAWRAASMWRYHELLPVLDERFVLTLGEGMTSLLEASRLAPKRFEQQARPCCYNRIVNIGAFISQFAGIALLVSLEQIVMKLDS
jgi:threonine synthase